MENDAYTRELLEGDIHTVNQRAAGLETRDQSKRFIYAYLYGAGAAKIGEVVGGGFKEGKQLLDRFNQRMPAVGRLRKAVESAAERGYLLGLDGRHIKIRSPHKALNSLLQGAGATIAATWLIETQKQLIEADLDANIMAWVHDEIQIQVRERDADHVGDIVRGSAKSAGETWDFRLPVAAEWQLGDSWADTH
jgi:DNA polymerase I-like protein with 3'-5' exonuclease and polymerase domains